MIGTTLNTGQGLGNQLFCYVTLRCMALDHGMDFAVLGGDTIANNIHSDCGLYFMEPLDFGVTEVTNADGTKRPIQESDFTNRYDEKEDRLFLPNSRHDLKHGAYITDADEKLLNPTDDTLYMGNMQDEKYYLHHLDEIKEWLKVKPEYDCQDFVKDNLCVIHLRCSDYLDNPELFLKKSYFIKGMKHMKSINPDMEFMIITNDVKEAEKILPGIKAYNFDLATDYAIIKNAKYLLLANSSFTYFPAICNENLKYLLAPKYWARHNVSNGYWASEQNIYSGWNYMDQKGRVFTSEECHKELEEWKSSSKIYKNRNTRPTGLKLTVYRMISEYKMKKHRLIRLSRGLLRKIRIKFGA